MRLTSKYINFLMEKNNYFAEDSLALKTSNVIKQLTNYDSNKQAIPSFVLEGPIGSDTSFYTEIYKKILQDVLDKEIYLVKYQGGSNDVSGLEENTIISEKLTEAISQANQGKQVLLLIDKCEYLDKEFDTFIHDFEKTGKVMVPKKGKLEVKPNCRENLQIILCVDDINSLAEPLIKRNAKIKLELMTPENLGKMIKMNLPNSNENIQSILMILYKKLYENKDNFAMFPSFSDTMQAIQDASDLLEKKASADIVFASILSNIVKHPDDTEQFKLMLQNDKQAMLIIGHLLKTKAQLSSSPTQDTIYRDFFSKELQNIDGLYFSQDDVPSNSGNSSNAINPIAMPSHLVNTHESVFSGTPANKWHQIIEFEVDEDGWDTIEQIVEKGYDFYLNIIKNSYPSSNLEDNISYQAQKKTLMEERFPTLLKSLCTDGMILQDDKKLKTKIVVVKESRNNSNFYKIFSNRRVQSEEIFGKQFYNKKSFDYFMLGCLGYDVIGINGFINALSNQKRFIKIKWDYMLFSLASEASKYRIENENAYKIPTLIPLAKKYKRVVPGVFLLKDEVISVNGQLQPINCTLDVGNATSLALPPEVTCSFLDMYDSMLEKEPEKSLTSSTSMDDNCER